MDAICSTSIFSGSGTGGSDGDSSVKSSWCLPDVPVAGSDGDRDGLREDLYDMSSLMAQLPMPPLRLAGSVLISRRGLSRFYGGKSQSFRSLGDVKAVEDLPEPGRRIGRRVGWKKQMNVAHVHGCSTLSKVIRKATRM